jgi:hypothetical protein
VLFCNREGTTKFDCVITIVRFFASDPIRGVPFGSRNSIAENTNGAVSFQHFERRREQPWHSRCPCSPAARDQHERVAIFRTVGERA